MTESLLLGDHAPKSGKRAMRLQIDQLPEEWRQDCANIRPDLDPGATFDQFRDYWAAKAGASACKLDWRATWRVWCRNSRYAKQPIYGAPQRPAVPRDTPRDTPVSTWQPPTPEQVAFARKLARMFRGAARVDDHLEWARKLKRRHIAGESLLPRQIEAYTEALVDEPPSDDELEAAAERSAIMAEGCA
jgi:hypothetical protein